MFRRIYLDRAEGLPQPFAIKFSQQWAAFCGCRYGLLLAHGTDALRIGLAAALDHDGLDFGGEIIVPNFSFIASATAALDRRFGVALVDVDPETLLIDPARVEEAIIPGRTRAILPVHLYGQPANIPLLKKIADKHGLKLIEDAAQAHGASWEGSGPGSLSTAAAFSFQSYKNLSCGEGGALVTNDQDLFDRAYAMHNVGRARVGGTRWNHAILGWNCRPTEYQAALLLHRLSRFEKEQELRNKNAKYLTSLFSELRSLQPLKVDNSVGAHGLNAFAMRYRPLGNLSIDGFLAFVQAEGMPIHRSFESTIANQPAIQTLIEKRPEYIRVLPTPVADQATRETVSIPGDVLLGTKADMEEIAAGIRKVERHFGAP
jgi:dTDP-4-amino-4,6-dideoxygalactose transaminase